MSLSRGRGGPEGSAYADQIEKFGEDLGARGTVSLDRNHTRSGSDDFFPKQLFWCIFWRVASGSSGAGLRIEAETRYGMISTSRVVTSTL